LVGTLAVTALTLAGCGRKGPLDPPPSAAVPTEGVRPANVGEAPGSPPPGAPKRDLFIDGLLN
jgi:hypothetical protein